MFPFGSIKRTKFSSNTDSSPFFDFHSKYTIRSIPISMEVSGVVSRRLPGLLRREIAQSVEISAADSRRFPCSLSVSGVSVSRRNFVAGFTPGNMDSRFCDGSHLQYYVGRRSHGKLLKKEKEEVKRKLKLLKGLSGELSASSQSNSVFQFGDVSVGEFQGKHISVEETREALERQLQQLKSEEKEQKRKRKLEKAKMKAAARAQTNHNVSSSSSSECSDNEGNVINTNYRITKALSQPFPDLCATNAIQVPTTLPSPPQAQRHDSNGENDSIGRVKVEVCTGNKCRKGGAGELMEEFERVVGVEGTVCGCKCMGKCRDGPNVRVSGSLDIVNPLCIGVGLEDVHRIVADFLGQPHNHSSLEPATAT